VVAVLKFVKLLLDKEADIMSRIAKAELPDGGIKWWLC